ncbi:hypothetical protein NHX12_025070 [Muraenolepis orangiensis]|uniref:HAT C-terminal dimerisation domain-containing protein n=1 Tax=Muraenolepis orangiensis TaxID=630683 RepID=A0A9Q0IRX2_9TELE|nr:hypothetical protein NHX12_025070 [Muraenolepis orangiensis]
MLSLTAQWIDADFQLRNVILHSQEFPGPHTAAALATAFENMFQTWNIPKEKVHVILRDNARNMVKAMKDAGWQSLGCMAHTLQLAVHEGVLSQRSISDIAAIGRRIVGHFKHSPLACSRLQNVQKDLSQTPKRLQQDVATRWNITYYMLKSLHEQKRALGAYVADFDLPDTFSASQWGLIENMLSLLEPFEELTQKISKASTSAADVIPSVMALKRFLGKEVASDHGVKTSKATLLEAVSRRFAEMEKEPLYSLATIIDPRYKDRLFSNEVKAEVKGRLLDQLVEQQIQPPDQAPGASAASDTDEPVEKVPRVGSVSSMLDEIMEEAGPEPQAHGDDNAAAVQSQVALYLSEPAISMSAQPLAYWRANQGPALTKVARAYLSAPCTSVESERLFSAVSNIVDEHRNRLLPQNAEMLLFVKKNLPTMLKK